MKNKSIVQYGTFSVYLEEFNNREIRLQMYEYIIAAINHNLDIDSYTDLYGKEYAISVQPNMADKELLKEYISRNKPVPFYAHSTIDSLRYIVESLNKKSQNDNLVTLMVLVENYKAKFNYIELILDEDNVIVGAYDYTASITYQEVSDDPSVMDIRAVFTIENKAKIELDTLEILI